MTPGHMPVTRWGSSVAWEESDVVGGDVVDARSYIVHGKLLWLIILTMLISLLSKLWD